MPLMHFQKTLLEKVRHAPDQPGCYLMRDWSGKIVYIGKANSLRKRVSSYFRLATLRNASPKSLALLHSIRDIEFIVCNSDAEAILTEGKLIKEYKPRFNVKFRDDKRFLLIKADPCETFPRLSLCRIQTDNKSMYFGPFPSSSVARMAFDIVIKKLGLRQCTVRMPDRQTYKHCINDIVAYCSAPCINKITAEQYRKRFNLACELLGSPKAGFIEEIKNEMNKSASVQDFERAVVLRDLMLYMRDLATRRISMTADRKTKMQDTATALREITTFLRLPHIPHLIEAFDISSISGTYCVGSMVCFVDGHAKPQRYRRYKIKSEETHDDTAMMAEIVRRRFTRIKTENLEIPNMVLIDGGAVHAKSARRELRKLGFGQIPVIGLAKRYEELYCDWTSKPIRLPLDSSALKLLQRIRDEAHRFAISYHLKLRHKRIRESILDEIPEIGPKRKKILLNHFGSVQKIAKATAEELSNVPTISKKMATIILEKLSNTT